MRALPRPRRIFAAGAAVAIAFTITPLVRAEARSNRPERPITAAARHAPATPALPDDARWGEFVDATDTTLRLAQPDGTVLRATMSDAAVGGALEVGGYSVVKGDDGWWRYASGRGADGMVASDDRAGLDATPAGVKRHVGRIADVWQRSDGSDVRSDLLRQLQMASRQASAKAAAGGGPRVFRFPVVLFATSWDETKGQTSPQFQPGDDVDHYKKILDGFGGNPTGTLTEFYFENSYGQFLVQVDVLAKPDGSPYVSTRASLPDDDGRCYYGGIDPPDDPLDDLDPLDTVIGAGGGGALGMGIELFNTTTLPVDHQFADYDNDGDGSIDFMGIIHSQSEMAVTGDPCNTWSHAIAISSFTGIVPGLVADQGLDLSQILATAGLDNVKAGLPVPGQTTTIDKEGLPVVVPVTYDRLFTMPEFETRGGTLSIGVATHEMAHALGESDFYGTDGSSSGSGDWDIMSGGSYGGTPSGSNPTWFNPETRVFQGWVTPTIVDESAPDYTFERRSSMPPGYTVDQANPNLVLVPTRWVRVGGTTTDEGLEHKWTENDVYGLPLDGDNGYVIEGWYLELASRMPLEAPGIHDGMTRESYFDRWVYGSGLLTWHFDYWRRSNVYFGQNGGNNDPNRMQLDVEEWDHNDNTQEIALNRNRAEASDVAWDAATGITSGTHLTNAFTEDSGAVGDPQAEIAIPSDTVTPVTPYDYDFTVDDNDANHTMRVSINTDLVGDCTLQLFRIVPDGPDEGTDPDVVAETELIDTGSFGGAEEAIITDPTPGDWYAEIGDFAGCVSASGTIEFTGPSGFDTTGTADTWSNHDQAPTGWAFTNIRTGGGEGLSHGTDAGGDGTLTVDIMDLSGETLDYSPGFVRGPNNGPEQGYDGITAGEPNHLHVPIFSNGFGDGADGSHEVDVEVHDGSATGPVIASGSVELNSYEQEDFDFDFDPGHEGSFDLVTVVDPEDDLEEGVEGNNVQKTTLWAGPDDATVLIVDDDGPGDTEQAYEGALAALGIPYHVVESSASGEQMSGYDAVIWVSTLDRGDGQLDERDRSELEGYLENGGEVWLSSNRAIEALLTTEHGDFGESWFGVRSADIDSFYKPVQMDLDDILGDKTIGIDVLPGRPFVDKYVLTPGTAKGTVTSLGVLQGSGTAALPGDGTAILGARVDGKGFRTAVTSFSLTQVREPGDAIHLVGAIMDHFGIASGQYAPDLDDPIVYHSQPRQTVSNVDLPVKAIVLALDEGGPVTLFYRHHGIGDFVALPMQPSGGEGGYLAFIPKADVTPDGIDYYIKAGSHSTFVPRAAESGDVDGAIAVFMPEVAAEPETPETPRTPATPDTPTAPAPPTAVEATDHLPATGGEAVPLLGGALGLGALGTRRLLRRRT